MSEEKLLETNNFSKRIYILDQNHDELEKLARSIDETFPNYEIVGVDSYTVLNDEIEDKKPSVIILSLDERTEDGFSLVKQLRDKTVTEKLPIIGIATRAKIEEIQVKLDRLRINVVPKPIRVPYLLDVITECIKDAQSLKAELIKLSTNEVLFRQGEDSHALYILHKGKLQVYMNDGESDKELGILEGTQTFGEMAFLSNEKRSASIKALEDSEVYKLKLDDFQKYLEDQPFWMNQLIQTLVQRLKDTNKKVLELQSKG